MPSLCRQSLRCPPFPGGELRAGHEGLRIPSEAEEAVWEEGTVGLSTSAGFKELSEVSVAEYLAVSPRVFEGKRGGRCLWEKSWVHSHSCMESGEGRPPPLLTCSSCPPGVGCCDPVS